MAHLIDKDALVEEIKHHLQFIPEHTNAFIEGEEHAYNKILSFLDTLEVKEDNLLTEKKTEKELAELYISIFDEKFGNKLPRLKSKQLADFKNFINTCEQIFHIK